MSEERMTTGGAIAAFRRDMIEGGVPENIADGIVLKVSVDVVRGEADGLVVRDA